LCLDDRICPTILPSGFSESLISAGLSNPTAMALAPDGRIFVAEQTGSLRVIENGSLLATPFVSLNVNSSGERGLLGIAFDPQFATQPFVYVYYTVPGISGSAPHNRVSRFTATGNIAAAGSEQILVDLEPLSATNHNGGAIHFGADGMLYVAVGDNAVAANSQSLSNRLGKILRYQPDGAIPVDNPSAFAGITGTTTGVNRAIWAVGLRNPFTFGVQPGTGRILINDVGQGAWEEINEGAAGRNFGWPATEGDFVQSSFPNFTRPLHAYPHGSGNFAGFAIVGGAFYDPAAPTFPADYAGDYFFGDLANGWINRFDSTSQSVENFASNLTLGSLVDLTVTPQGDLLYLSRGSGNGAVYRISFSSAPSPFPPGPAPILAGPGAGAAPAVQAFDPQTGNLLGSLPVFDSGFSGGVRVATGDVTGDGVADIIAGAGPGSVSRVVVLDGTNFQIVHDFQAFESSFKGGVFVSAGDFNKDGKADVIVSPDAGGGPRVRVLNGADGKPIADFFAIEDLNFRGGARVAAGDLNGDSTIDLIVTAGLGGGPRVAAYDGKQLGLTGGPKLFNDFFAFEQTLRNGTFVAAGDVNADGFADLVAGGGPGGGPRVFILDGKSLIQNGSQTLIPVGNYFAGDPASRNGVRVAVKSIDNDALADVVAAVGNRITAYRGATIIAIMGSPPATLDFDAFAGIGGEVFVG
jgi:glucose/arabinose dehydrogenase